MQPPISPPPPLPAPPLPPPPNTPVPTGTTWPAGTKLANIWFYEMWKPREYTGNCQNPNPQMLQGTGFSVYISQVAGLNPSAVTMLMKGAIAANTPDPWTTVSGFAEVPANTFAAEDKTVVSPYQYLKFESTATGAFRTHVILGVDNTVANILADSTNVLDCTPLFAPAEVSAVFNNELGWDVEKFTEPVELRDLFPANGSSLMAALVVSCGRVMDGATEITTGATVVCEVQVSSYGNPSWNTIYTFAGLSQPNWLLQRLAINPSDSSIRLKMTFSGIMGAKFEIASELFYFVE